MSKWFIFRPAINQMLQVDDELKSSVDLLLVSDCVYYEQSLEPLVCLKEQVKQHLQKHFYSRWPLWQASHIPLPLFCFPMRDDRKKVFLFPLAFLSLLSPLSSDCRNLQISLSRTNLRGLLSTPGQPLSQWTIMSKQKWTWQLSISDQIDQNIRK